jgi:hypothetical protein
MLFPVGVKSPAPGLSGRAPLRRGEEVLERHVEEGAAGLGKHVRTLPQLGVHMETTAAAVHHPGGNGQPAVDQHGRPVTDEHPDGDAREPVPCGEQSGGLVQRRADKPSVDDPGRRLVAVAEPEIGLVAVDALLGRQWEVNAVRVLVPTPPARRVMVWGNPLYRRPPRSKWAL